MARDVAITFVHYRKHKLITTSSKICVDKQMQLPLPEGLSVSHPALSMLHFLQELLSSSQTESYCRGPSLPASLPGSTGSWVKQSARVPSSAAQADQGQGLVALTSQYASPPKNQWMSKNNPMVAG